jgi:hypothetical protein
MGTGQFNPQAARVLVIVPAYNESESICRTLRKLRRLPRGFDVVVVNDGSTDATAALACATGVPVLDLPCNLGVGGAIQTGYQYAFAHDYDAAVQFDADGQHRVSEIPALLEPVLDGRSDVAVGSRFLGGLRYRFSVERLAGSRFLKLLLRALSGQTFTDPTSGFRAAGREAIRFFSAHYPHTWLADTVEVLLKLSRRGYRICDVPVRMARRREGRSAAGRITGLMHLLRITLAVLVERIERIEPSERARAVPAASSEAGRP